jgi:soluble lytic murein transglycosylase
LGEPLFALPAPPEDTGSVAAAVSAESKEDSAVKPDDVDPEEYALGLARFGLGHRLRLELGPEFGLLSEDTVRQVAEALWSADRHDHAYRLIATQFWKSDFLPTRRDAELYWPRPYRETFTAAAQATGMDEFLLYGLARSESAFDRVVVSKSGAVGLTQLMPATAAETAARLRLTGYDLTDPVDNLTLGSAYFAKVLAGVDGRVLPAVFSYNGGPTRFRRWEAEYGDLPLDLMLEALSYEETRQYGRNVISAALSYAALYGEDDLRSYFAWLLGEAPHP